MNADAQVAKARKKLVRLLRLAHAGERAAAFAYRGHARSVRDAGERAAITRIEAEEWEHRACLAGMLAGLGSGPSPLREPLMAAIGRVLGLACHASGWFLPMYGAGWIERRNVHEYVDAAVFARAAGLEHLVRPLMAMAEVEYDHELYFRGRVVGHPGLCLLPLWHQLPTRAALWAALGPLLEEVNSLATTS